MKDAAEAIEGGTEYLADALRSLQADMRRNREIIEIASNELQRQETLADELQHMLQDRKARAGRRLLNVRAPVPFYALVLDRARAYMQIENRPLTRQEVLAKMLQEGHLVDVNDPPHFVGKTLWKSADFVAFKEGYWPADLPAPDGVTPSRRRMK